MTKEYENSLCSQAFSRCGRTSPIVYRVCCYRKRAYYSEVFLPFLDSCSFIHSHASSSNLYGFALEKEIFKLLVFTKWIHFVTNVKKKIEFVILHVKHLQYSFLLKKDNENIPTCCSCHHDIEDHFN